MSYDSSKFPIVLYDTQCPLCVRFRDSIVRIDSEQKIQFVSIYNPDIYVSFPQLDPKQTEDIMHVLVDEEIIVTGGEAIKHLITVLPKVQKFSWLVENNMGQKALDYFYLMSKKYRDSLRNRCPACKKS